jgi:hypothetical protein
VKNVSVVVLADVGLSHLAWIILTKVLFSSRRIAIGIVQQIGLQVPYGDTGL